MAFIDLQEATETFGSAKKKSLGGYSSPSSIDPNNGIHRFTILSSEAQFGRQVMIVRPDGTYTSRRCKKEPTPALLSEFEKDAGGSIVVRDGKPPSTPYIAFFVYEYESAMVKLYTITQKGLVDEITNKSIDKDFQPLSDWDVEINRNGKGLDTRYTLTMKRTLQRDPDVKAEVEAALAEAEAAGFDLDQHLLNGNPFGKSA